MKQDTGGMSCEFSDVLNSSDQCFRSACVQQEERSEKPSQREKNEWLTTEEAVSVEMVTVRESTAHRRWPKEALDAFLAADLASTHQEIVWNRLAFKLSRRQTYSWMKLGLFSKAMRRRYRKA
jgi:hypothetical protein